MCTKRIAPKRFGPASRTMSGRMKPRQLVLAWRWAQAESGLSCSCGIANRKDSGHMTFHELAGLTPKMLGTHRLLPVWQRRLLRQAHSWSSREILGPYPCGEARRAWAISRRDWSCLGSCQRYLQGQRKGHDDITTARFSGLCQKSILAPADGQDPEHTEMASNGPYRLKGPS